MSGSKHYKVAPGATFRDGDGSVKSGGDTIELGDDVAPEHIRAGRVEPTPLDDSGAEGVGIGE